jgi:hypothetical protein
VNPNDAGDLTAADWDAKTAFASTLMGIFRVFRVDLGKGGSDARDVSFGRARGVNSVSQYQ